MKNVIIGFILFVLLFKPMRYVMGGDEGLTFNALLYVIIIGFLILKKVNKVSKQMKLFIISLILLPFIARFLYKFICQNTFFTTILTLGIYCLIYYLLIKKNGSQEPSRTDEAPSLAHPPTLFVDKENCANSTEQIQLKTITNVHSPVASSSNIPDYPPKIFNTFNETYSNNDIEGKPIALNNSSPQKDLTHINPIINLVAIEKFLDDTSIFQKIIIGTLCRDRENRFDSNAISVQNNINQQIAFVGKEFASELAPQMDKGWAYRIETIPNSYTSKKWGMCKAYLIVENMPEYIKTQFQIAEKIGMIYHMTHIDNLKNIYLCGLLAKNDISDILQRNIADNEIQERRSHISVLEYSLHDCVPFYINVRNAMLYRVLHEYGRDNIIILGIAPKTYAQYDFFVSDRNAATAKATFYRGSDTNLLTQLNWTEIHQYSWSCGGERNEERKQIMQSEVLIPHKVPFNHCTTIFCSSENSKKQVQSILSDCYVNIDIRIDPTKFF